jgi:hypothetical protein
MLLDFIKGDPLLGVEHEQLGREVSTQMINCNG